MMFLCKNCEGVFKEATEKDTCPYCDSEDFMEAKQCDECGEWVDDNDTHYVEEKDCLLCSDCYRSEANKLSPRGEFELSEFCRGWDEYVA